MPSLTANEQLEGARLLKQAMGYRDPAPVCKSCRFFVDYDQSGSINAKPAHCTANKLELPVSERGCCDHHTHRQFTSSTDH